MKKKQVHFLQLDVFGDLGNHVSSEVDLSDYLNVGYEIAHIELIQRPYPYGCKAFVLLVREHEETDKAIADGCTCS